MGSLVGIYDEPLTGNRLEVIKDIEDHYLVTWSEGAAVLSKVYHYKHIERLVRNRKWLRLW